MNGSASSKPSKLVVFRLALNVKPLKAPSNRKISSRLFLNGLRSLHQEQQTNLIGSKLQNVLWDDRADDQDSSGLHVSDNMHLQTIVQQAAR
jgi:hypothetical protein